MNGAGIGAAVNDRAPAGNSKSCFSSLVSDTGKGPVTAFVDSGAVEPGFARPQSTGEQGRAMPDDADFLVVDDVTMETTADGEEVAVVSGEAVTAEKAEVLAAKGDSVIVALPESRFANRAISGSMFASILIDQRNGVLPNPFSLMRIPEQPAAPAQTASVQTAAAPAPVAPIAAIETQGQALPDAPGADAVAEGKEISRLEAAISLLIEKLEGMLKSMRVLVGNLARQQGGASATNIPPEADALHPGYTSGPAKHLKSPD